MSELRIEPSDEFVRLKAARKEIREKLLEEHDLDKLKPLHEELDRIHAALHATPEQQFLDEVRKDEIEVWEKELAAELSRRGKMTTAMSLDCDGGVTVDQAIREEGFNVSHVTNEKFNTPLMVFADTQRMNPTQIAAGLRMMADRVEGDGIFVYHGPYPLRPSVGDDWWVTERVDGSLMHERFDQKWLG